MADIEDVGTAILVILRLFAFIIGVAFLASGFADFGGLGSDVLLAFFSGPVAIVKIVVGLTLMILAIEPAAIDVIVQWIVRS